MKKVRRLIFLFIFSLAAGSCTTIFKRDFTWEPGIVAPDHYAIWVDNFELERSGKSHWRLPVGYISCCWGKTSGKGYTMGRNTPIPNMIGIRWFSYAEQKLYGAVFNLPDDLEARMRRQGPFDANNPSGEQGLYDSLVIGLAPGGTIAVWIMVSDLSAVEILRTQAVELEVDPSDYRTQTKKYFEEEGDYLKEHGIPTTGW